MQNFMFDLLKTHREITPQLHVFDAVPPKMGPVPPPVPPENKGGAPFLLPLFLTFFL